MTAIAPPRLALDIAAALERRNAIAQEFFDAEAARIADASRLMSERFLRGGRLLAFGRGACATDAQHVAVEFVHPVIVGKRALPALDLSIEFAASLDALVTPDDIVMGFAPPGGNAAVAAALRTASERGALTFALPGTAATVAVRAIDDDPFVQQEIIEMFYHVLWETVHVYFEHQPIDQDAGSAAFLYPFLGTQKTDVAALSRDVAGSIRAKVADDAALRSGVAREYAGEIAAACMAIDDRLAAGGMLLMLGNGGSATDANDFAIDCVAPPAGYRPLPAISLASEPANITAIANDIGTDVIFSRQLIAQARDNDVVIAFSTSGGSANVLMALEEARKRGLLTVAILGYDGGEIRRRELADHCLVVPSAYIPRIQEVQASIYHVMRDSLEGLARDRG